MMMMAEKMKNARGAGAFAGSMADRCCGDCRFCREMPDKDQLRCMRHKIDTNFAALCYAWEKRVITD